MSAPGAQLLLVHADRQVAATLAEELGPGWPPPLPAAGLAEALPLLGKGPRVDLCLLEGTLAVDAAAVAALRKADPDLEFVGLLPRAEAKSSPLALRAGCGDLLLWPADPEYLRALVARSAERCRLRRDNRRLSAENAGQAGRLAELAGGMLWDDGSRAYSRAYFADYVGKEIYKARRYGRWLSVVGLQIGPRLDGAGEPQGRLEPAALAGTLRALVDRIAPVIRDADILARVSADEIYAVLPETDRFGAMVFERRLGKIVGELEAAAPAAGEAPAVTIGGATFPADGDDLPSLLGWSRGRMEEARQTLRRRLQLEPLGFWETVEVLVGPRAARLGALSEDRRASGASHYGPLPRGHFEALQREVCRELVRHPRAGGFFYVGVPELRADGPLLAALPEGVELGARVYLLGGRGPAPIRHPAVTPVYTQDAPVAGGGTAHGHDFALYLAERAAYAFVRRRTAGEPTFHTSDRLLVDHLVSRLQQAYDLQPH